MDAVTVNYTLDNMERGKHDYYQQLVVIKQNIEKNDLARGSVVWFEDEHGEHKISRVVGLPNEKIEIEDGQIFINDQYLDSFYGKAHRAGLDKKQYLKTMKDAQSDYDEQAVKGTFEKDLDKMSLGEMEYYLVSDDWFRGEMSVVTEQQILGLVLGYKK
ncbi:S26 family signal peptidase [Robertmurraya sp. Marseille-Q9965]